MPIGDIEEGARFEWRVIRHWQRQPFVRLLASPEAVSIDAAGWLPGIVTRAADVTSVRRGFFGGIRIESRIPGDTAIGFTTLGENREIFERLAELGYPAVDGFPFLQRWRIPLLGAVLALDAMVLIGLIVVSDGWLIVPFMVAAAVTLWWALPRLW